MRRCLSIALATAALLNLWAITSGPRAQQQTPAPAPQQPASAAPASAPPPESAAPQSPPAAPQTAPAAPSPAVAQPVPQGGRAKSATATGDARQPKVKAAGAGSVTIKDFSFGPSSISVHVGDTVTWANNGPTDHTATASNGSFDTGTLKKGQSASHTFTSAGSFSYICSIHPFMKGTVVVVAGAGTSAPRSSGAAPAGPSPTPSSPTREGGPTPSGGLPNTGIDVGLVLFSGALLIASGLLLRRTAR